MNPTYECEVTHPFSESVVVASCAPTAIELLASGDFDAVLCDLHLRGLHGVDLYERLRASRPRLAARIVFLTGGGASATERDLLAHHHLVKPRGPDRVRSAITSLTR